MRAAAAAFCYGAVIQAIFKETQWTNISLLSSLDARFTSTGFSFVFGDSAHVVELGSPQAAQPSIFYGNPVVLQLIV